MCGIGNIFIYRQMQKDGKCSLSLKGSSKEDDAFGQIVEVTAPVANELDLFKAKDGDKTNHELRIVEIEFKENLHQ